MLLEISHQDAGDLLSRANERVQRIPEGIGFVIVRLHLMQVPMALDPSIQGRGNRGMRAGRFLSDTFHPWFHRSADRLYPATIHPATTHLSSSERQLSCQGPIA